MTIKRRHEMGDGGCCVCSKCGEKTLHRDGVPCQEERCPACGVKLLREGSHHHKLLQQKQQEKMLKKDSG
ncbi:MAG: ferredoxin [Gammaproteobacteria bacterium]|nr:ferredoxin [Gammaproteobacteria bacterium]